MSSSAQEVTSQKPRTSTVIKNLTVKLTEEETLAKANAAAQYQSELTEYEDELDGHSKRIKPEIKKRQEDIKDLLNSIEAGEEERTVECEMIEDFASNTVRYMFEGKEIDSRAMTEEDRQLALVDDKDEDSQDEANT